jgi:hypothetical protein
MFNCHGMTFGSRRCWIDDVATLIEEDCLVEVVPNRVMPGDIALYYSSEFGDWEHSAIVIASGAGPFFIPTVVSKWGAWREVIHLANSSPYNFGGIRYFRIDS